MKEYRKNIPRFGGRSRRRVGAQLAVFILVFFLFAVSVSALYVSFVVTQLPSPSALSTKRISQSTKIYDRTGEMLLFEAHGDEKRTIIPFEEIPGHMKQAVLAAEDANFYNEPAFDWKGIVRAAIVNLRAGRVVQGGSTITQQLAKNVFLSPERTLTRKAKELVIAVQLEARYTKNEILWLYLNQIPFGSNLYGVEEASRAFFNKPVKEATLAESAVLAALLQAPSYYSPWGNNTQELLERKDYVLDRMAELGFAPPSDVLKAKRERLVFLKNPVTVKAYHFTLMVRDYLVSKYGEDLIERGGLRVKTTLDWDLQQIAERVVKEGAARNADLYQGYNAALVAQDPKTGQVLSFVGSKDPDADSEPSGCVPGSTCKFEPDFNVPTQGLRQPGSALKPFAYLAAFQKGFGPESLVFDAPTEFVAQDPRCPALVDFSSEISECFHPQNYDGTFRGPISLAEALAQSINVPAVKVLYLAGFDDTLRTLKNFGISTLAERARYGLSLVLGGGEVRLSELVNAYATFATDGVRHAQVFVLEVKDSDGRVLEGYKDEADRVAEVQHPRLINSILSSVELRSGLFHGSLPLTVFPGRDVALKTGTTNDYRDAWAIGYTPSLTVGVWAGNNDNVPMQQRGGSILAAVPIWSAFLSEALPRFPAEFFSRPAPYALSPKPMMSGEVQPHTILQYVAKGDPLGPAPAAPYLDSQYQNWEQAAQAWVASHPGAVRSSVSGGLTAPFTPSVGGAALAAPKELSLTFLAPTNGSFVRTPFGVQALLSAPDELARVELYMNDKLVSALNIRGTTYVFNWLVFNAVQPQNLIELRALSASGTERRASVVVYQQQ